MIPRFIASAFAVTATANTVAGTTANVGASTAAAPLHSIQQQLDTAKSYINNVDCSSDSDRFEKASEYLADEFQFRSPKYNCESKSHWISRFPEMTSKHNLKPKFENPTVDDKSGKITRKGTIKLGFVHVNLQETFEFDDFGLIKSITAARI